MSYRARMGIALALSVVIHGAVLGPRWAAQRETALEPVAEEVPLRVSLVPEPEPARRLVDSVVPSDTPPDATDLMSEADTRASDLTGADEDSNAPDVDLLGDFEDLGGAMPEPAPAVEPAPAAEPVAEPAVELDTTRDEPLPEPVEVAARPPSPAPAVPRPVTPAPSRPAVPSPPVEDPTPEPLPPSPVRRDTPTQARVEGEAQNQGFLGFEAMRHELAPYMKVVRDAVERRWRIAIQMKYSGTDPTRAVIDCAIAPDGRLVYVEIVDPGTTLSYGALCKEAIEKAGPFPPFPFKVPEMYANENLRIRWTFNYL